MYLKSHNYQIIKNRHFPNSPEKAILYAFEQIEDEFNKKSVNSKGEIINKSGSCAIIIMTIGQK